MATDAALVTAWRAGDQVAGRTLFERHVGLLSRFFRNKVGQEREDLIQQTFLACLESSTALREDGSFRAYLLKAARSKLVDHYGARGRVRARVDPLTQSVADLGMSPSREAVRHEQQRVLLRALRRLPLDLQIMVELHYWEDLSTAELAEVLGVPQGTVKTRLLRARTLVRKAMTELARSPELLQSTVDDLEGWARSLREVVDGDDGYGPRR